MIATRLTTHIADAKARMLTQFVGRPIITSIISMLAGAVQDAEDLAYPVGEGRQLAHAQGVQLDRIGELVGFARGGLEDGPYRVLLLATIASNNSKADTETLLRIIESVFSAKGGQVISPFSPGHARRQAPAVLGLEVGSPAIDKGLYDLVIRLVQNSIAAGVTLSWVSTYDDAEGFALAGPNQGLGLGSNNSPDSGGKLATLIYNNQAN